MQVLNGVYGSKAATIGSGSRSIPVQQQVILCALLMFSKHKKRREVEVGKCFEAFVKICSKRSIGYDVGNNSDFLSMCQLLESKGFLSLRVAKEARLTKVSLAVDEDEVREVMGDKTMFSAILRDSSPFF
jgi:cell division control protein 6